MHIFGLWGPDPSSELVAPNKSLHYWPFSTSICVAQTEISLEVVLGDIGTKFPHLKISVMPFYALDLPPRNL